MNVLLGYQWHFFFTISRIVILLLHLFVKSRDGVEIDSYCGMCSLIIPRVNKQLSRRLFQAWKLVRWRLLICFAQSTRRELFSATLEAKLSGQSSNILQLRSISERQRQAVMILSMPRSRPALNRTIK